MKQYIFFIVIVFAILLGADSAFAQGGYIYTVAGNGTAGYSGDGGPAQSAELNGPTDVCTDHAGNIYIVDQGNNRIRRVIAGTGIISTIAGTGVAGYTGDGGPATVAKLNTPNGIAVDGAGNVYIADQGNHVIRKINTSGIISTMAGTGVAGFSGDGGLAISARLNTPTSVTVDAAGNLYIGDEGNARIREISAGSGIITTIAGGGGGGGGVGGGGYSTTVGVSATSVSLCTIHNLAVDAAGNIYFTNQGCIQFLKLTPTGLLFLEEGIFLPWGVSTDIAGNVYMGTNDGVVIKANAAAGGIDTLVSGYGYGGAGTGDGGPSISASLSSPNGIYTDIIGNVYVADQGHSRIRLITSSLIATYNADSFSVFVDELCSGPQLTISTNRYLSTFNQTTYYGDGTSYSSPVLGGYGGTAGYCAFVHSYSYPGTYSLRTVLSNGSTPIDSFMYTYEYTQCVTMPVKFYDDANGNGSKDTGEFFTSQPVLTEVDSNGTPVDTISCTGGFYYTAHGVPGDVYRFKILSVAGGLTVTTPASGVLYDTIVSGVNNLYAKYVGVQCLSGSGFDLAVNAVIPVTGVHDEWGNVYVSNNSCYPIPSDATVTVHYSRKYNVDEGGGGLDVSPTPSSYTDSTITWNVSGLSSSASHPVDLYYAIWTNLAGGYLTPGDTVSTYVTVTPTLGDIDLSNNYCVIHDTVKAGCDPNEMWVSPTGYISAGSQLKYTAEFVNTGNDTAHNIYIMDTLSDNVDPHSLRVVSASATMNIGMFMSAGHTIVKFDFPNINLLDSSHHGLCTGMVIFTINSKAGLPDCSKIFNHAGIFFDINPVVMTDTVENIIGLPPTAGIVTGSSSVCVGSAITLSDSIVGGTWSTSCGNATVSGGVVSGVDSGGVIIYYTVPAACGPVTSMFSMTVGAPSAGLITSSSGLCVGMPVILVDPITGGVWSASNSNAFISGSVITGIAAGLDTIYYSVSNICGSSSVQQIISIIDTLPDPGTIFGSERVCVGASIILTDMAAGGVWSSTADATVYGGVVTGLTSGDDSIFYSVTNACGVVNATKKIAVYPLPFAGIITGPTSLCVGSDITLSTTAYGGTWDASNGNATVSGGVVSGAAAGTDAISYTITNICGTASAIQMVEVDTFPAAGTINGADSVCAGNSIMLSDLAIGGVWSASNANATVYGGLVTGAAAGADSIIYIVNNICGTASASVIVNILSSSQCTIASNVNYLSNLSSVSVFPNPATDELTIKISGSSYPSFTITNSIGQEIISQPLPGTNGSTIQANVNTSTLPAGLYYIIFKADSGTEVRKFVKL